MQSTSGQTYGAVTGSVSAAHSLHWGPGPSRYLTGLPTPSCQLSFAPPEKETGYQTPRPGSRPRRGRNHSDQDATQGSGPSKERGQQGAGTPARPAPPQGARPGRYSSLPQPDPFPPAQPTATSCLTPSQSPHSTKNSPRGRMGKCRERWSHQPTESRSLRGGAGFSAGRSYSGARGGRRAGLRAVRLARAAVAAVKASWFCST